jgi:tight adherence protein B
MAIFAAILFFCTTFLAVGLTLLLVWLGLQKMQIVYEAEEAQLPETSKLLRNESISTISIWAKLLERFNFVNLMKRQIEQAGLNWSIGRVTLSMLLAGTVTLVVLVKGDWLPGWMNTALAYAASLLPYLFIWRRRKARFAKFELQFPDALDSLSRALRAGHPFAVAFDMVANESEPPVSEELRRTAVEGNFGTSWQQALANLSNRVPILEVSMFAAAVQLHSRTGGKLGDVLGTLSEGMRESLALKGEVQAIAAHGKLTGLVLTVLPLVIALIMSVVNPSCLGILFTNPYGKYLLAAAAICLVAAHFVIRRIVDIKI